MAAVGQQAIGYANDRSPNVRLHLIGSLILIGIIVFVCLSPYQTLMKITASIASLSVAYACLRLMACLTPKPRCAVKAEGEAAIECWPFYTVLVPLFREANMVAPLISALAKIDYPADRLEILMVCEEIDAPTVKAVRSRIGGIFHIVIVPPGTPQTKPRALNYALHRARGDFVTIYDAEDVPHPGQLKEAVRAFHANPELGAAQAPLDYANDMENALTRQFALEYAALFHVWLPFLASAGLPFPLGGTSNHMRGLM
jgi:cellulose synthase/poly-beta-1,6-N-acetylglucosamine synthase-like glycosyltransferase